MNRKTLYLIDAYSIIYKAFFAIKKLSTRNGLPTNAVYGFMRSVMKVVKEKSPDYLVVAFDSKEPSFRKEIYTEYKANRPEMPDDLQKQIPYIQKMIDYFAIDSLAQPGLEADDLIGVLSHRYGDQFDIKIVSSDKDLFQLINENVKVVDIQKDIEFNSEAVKEKYGVGPEGIPDLFGLIGDSSDNIPGVMGIGLKTGMDLMGRYGNLENLYEHIDDIKGKVQEKLITDKEKAFLSRDLATIKTDYDKEINITPYNPESINREGLEELLTELEFISVLNEIFPDRTGFQGDYGIINTPEAFAKFLDRIKKSEMLAVDLETTDIDPINAEIVGIGLSDSPEFGRYIPVAHKEGEQLDKDAVLPGLKPILENPSIKKVGHNLKYEFIILKRNGIELDGIYMDTSVGAYVLNPLNPRTNLDSVCLEYLKLKKTPISALIGEKKCDQKCFSEVPIEDAYKYTCEDVDAPLRLEKIFREKMLEQETFQLMTEVEMPLVKVLGEMELNGVKIEVEHFERLEKKYDEVLENLTKKIHESAGTDFNINSPKQLSEILFDRMKLKPVKKTKTGISTDFEVLTELQGEHEIIDSLLEYRKINKLQNTYITSLKNLINPRTGLIHTSFNQTITSTGRLSSSNPNLQNIPIKTEEGREIRNGFIARAEDRVIISADYSQIELRFLAHFSEDPELVKAFEKGEDIHARTAALIFDVDPGFVTSEFRRIAKKVNFGIVYGQTPFGLSKELGISQAQAKKFIDNYFNKYNGVKTYMNSVIDFSRVNGYVTTILGRRRDIPELYSKTPATRSFGERIAINTPLQGSAADLIKKALIEIYEEFKREKLETKIIL
ncbi:MAG: DNA polymerase I, partial [bacterium]|nr:DNA polymerase I [bacterium]